MNWFTGSNTFAHLRGFHDDWKKNVTSRVHVIQLTGTIFKLNSHIKETNVRTKFHENLAKNVTSRVFTLLTSHVIRLIETIFKLNSHIKETNVLTKFLENWAKNVTSRVFTYFHYIHIDKNAPPTGGHVNQRSASFSNSFEISIKTSKSINVASRVFTNKCGRTDDGRTDDGQRPVTKAHLSNQTDLPTYRHTIFKLTRDVIQKHVLRKFYEEKNACRVFRIFSFNLS
ncbi:hypothetical protein DPMN_028363 [Dreissena polymorpha]|uniref:Uncharacterized protein n=1 Tax=Dreissena polymorpha TaxID=45954 RepID=A0A9D4LWU5_DREPO|nr:hypothetical protein DPMN_028363 [Dreissena polymorpha]